MIPTLETLAAQGTADIARLLREAYRIGREDMRRELMTLLSPSGENTAPAPSRLSDHIIPAYFTAKAPPGTVKPALLALISRDEGANIRDMEATGVKHNSIRGTMFALQKEGKIEKRGDRWYRVESEKIEATSKLEVASQ